VKLSPGSVEALAILGQIAATTQDEELAERVKLATLNATEAVLPLTSTQPEAQA